MEILSPAGSWEAMKAAATEGADAVYFGTSRFNARRKADDLSDDNLRKAVSFLHDRGIRAYAAFNTLVKNNELKYMLAEIEQAYSLGVDAVIIQHISLAKIIKEQLPAMQVHASTQTAVFSSHYLQFLSGFDRVILPRELSISQIKEFTETCGIDTEVFVQGALCFSISGQCLMSSFMGGRSGNRGLCAQPCRKRYGRGFRLSTMDLCAADDILALQKAGVSCVKIEGRMRSTEYVGAATAFYRKLIDDGVADPYAFQDMALAFSRGYTRGAMAKRYDVATLEAGGKRGLELGAVDADGFITLLAHVMVGDGIGISSGKRSHGDLVRGIEAQGKALDAASAGQRVRLKVNARPGDTITLTSGKRRRPHPQGYVRSRIQIQREKLGIKMPQHSALTNKEPKILALAHSCDQALSALDAGADSVFYDVFQNDHPKGAVGAYIPRALPVWAAESAAGICAGLKYPDCLCADLGAAALITDKNIYLDINCNAFNDIDIKFLNDGGMVPTVSPELTFAELRSFSDKRFAVYAHGRVPLMTTRYKLSDEPISDGRYTFPVRKHFDCKQILNSVPLGIFSKAKDLIDANINTFLLDLWGEPDGIVSLYRKILSGKKVKKPKGYTLGRYADGVA